VVPRGLGGDEQARRDLRVGQAFPKQREHLPLALAEQAEALGPRPAGHAAIAQERRGGVRVSGRAEALKLRESDLRLPDGDLWLRRLERPGELESRTGGIQRQVLRGER
jgi:hypothetical protein